MNTNRSIIKLAIIVLGAALLVPSTAVAQNLGRGPRAAIRTPRPSSVSIARPSRGISLPSTSRLQRSPSNGRIIAPRSSGSHSGRSPYSLGDIIGGLEGSSRNRGWDPYGSRNGYDGYYGRHDNHGNSIADAYRDVGIANALVNLVGILAETQMNNQMYNRNVQPYYQPAQPAGHYERRQVLIKEGYYEDYRVWIPEFQDQQTRDVIAGHYETHRRWVPPVYGFQDVWVPEPVAVGP